MKTLFAQAAFCILLGIVAYSIATEYSQYNAWFNENISYANYLSTQLTNMGIQNTISNNFEISIHDTRLLPNLTTQKNEIGDASTLFISVSTKDLESVIAKITHLFQKDQFISSTIRSWSIRAIKDQAQEIDLAQIRPSITFRTTHSDNAQKLLETINQELKQSTIKGTIL